MNVLSALEEVRNNSKTCRDNNGDESSYMSGNESQLGFHPLYSRELLYYYARATVLFIGSTYLVLFDVMERNRSHFESISL